MSVATNDITKTEAYKALQAKDKLIQRELIAVSDETRKKYPWLHRNQNTVGMMIFLVSIAGMALNAWLYYIDVMPAWLVIVLTAFWTSLLHELEHDLIHLMYFKKQKFWHNLMILGVYIARPLNINPWIRRYMHYRHHKMSGTPSDIEERGITNGEKWGVLRFLMVGDHLLAVYLRAKTYITEPHKLYKKGEITKENLKDMRLVAMFSYIPVGGAFYVIWHAAVIYMIANAVAALFGTTIAWPQWVVAQEGWVGFMVVTLLAPNALRVFCLHFISSNMHYYGDIEKGIIHKQCQVMNKWYLAPFHLFCFNFGSTHAIHHFVVRDTFYMRQLGAKQSHEVLRKHGVRFNDMGTFSRANRYEGYQSATA